MKYALPAALLLCAGEVLAQAMPPGPPGGPPPAAFAACSDAREDQACSFETPRGQLNGLCRTMREGRPVCVPAGAPGGPGRPVAGGDMRPFPAQGGPDGSRRPLEFGANPPQTAPGFPPEGGGARVPRADIAALNPDANPVRSRIPDTGQGNCFDAHNIITCPRSPAPYAGQDAAYLGAAPAYRNNGDGTISDLVTGLTWQRAHADRRVDYRAAEADCHSLDLGGHRDWRLPNIKELFSIADYRGTVGRRPYIDTRYFEFREPGPEVLQGDPFVAPHRPEMMGQTWSSTRYTGVHYGRPGVEAAFFFNFLDGRIKQAPTRTARLFHRCVRGPTWGDNDFSDRRDGSVDDRNSGLVWQQRDDGQPRDWPAALAYCASLDLAGRRDWRLPNAKELQSIVDYRHHAPALDQRYLQTSDPKAWYWSSTTLGDNLTQAVYVCFGACTDAGGLDVHGAGALRSDPKLGDPRDYVSQGGQRDQIRIRNLVRCVRSAP